MLLQHISFTQLNATADSAQTDKYMCFMNLNCQTLTLKKLFCISFVSASGGQSTCQIWNF